VLCIMENAGAHERASSTVEFVGMAAAAAVLIGGLGIGLSGQGAAVARAIADGLHHAIAGDADPGRAAPARSAPSLRAESFAMTDHAYRSARVAHERRWETSEDAPRVPRSDLRMNPVLPSLSIWRASRSGNISGPAGLSASGTATTCLVCVDAQWRDGFQTGVITSSSFKPGSGDLVNADVRAEARVAAVGVDLLGIVQQRAGWGGWKIQGRARATVGADADGRIQARAGRDELALTASGGAMAGGVVRGEARAGIDLLGAAATARARVEGWAGAGVRGTASVSRRGSVVTWDAGAGAALGLGGSVEWGGSIDVSHVRASHRSVALATLGIAANIILPGSAGIFHHFTPTHRSN
jgi:hypothetical protein